MSCQQVEDLHCTLTMQNQLIASYIRDLSKTNKSFKKCPAKSVGLQETCTTEPTEQISISDKSAHHEQKEMQLIEDVNGALSKAAMVLKSGVNLETKIAKEGSNENGNRKRNVKSCQRPSTASGPKVRSKIPVQKPAKQTTKVSTIFVINNSKVNTNSLKEKLSKHQKILRTKYGKLEKCMRTHHRTEQQLETLNLNANKSNLDEMCLHKSHESLMCIHNILGHIISNYPDNRGSSHTVKDIVTRTETTFHSHANACVSHQSKVVANQLLCHSQSSGANMSGENILCEGISTLVFNHPSILEKYLQMRDSIFKLQCKLDIMHVLVEILSDKKMDYKMMQLVLFVLADDVFVPPIRIA